MSKEELKNKILQDLKKTGFINELKLVDLLSTRGWTTQHSRTYLDRDESKSREIDIVASLRKFNLELGFGLDLNLVVEVKKSKNPWIVFTTKSSIADPGWRIIHSGTNFQRVFTTANPLLESTPPVFNLSSLIDYSPRQGIQNIGRAFHEFNKNPTDKSTIYGALMSASKAALHISKPVLDKPIQDFEPGQSTYVSIFLPTVVLDGTLYEAKNDELGKISLDETNFVPMELHYSSPNYSHFQHGITLFPDMVCLDHFETHLEKTELWFEKMFDSMSSDLKNLGKTPRSLSALLRQQRGNLTKS